MAIASMQMSYKNKILAMKNKTKNKTKQNPTPWKLIYEYSKVVGYKFNEQKSLFSCVNKGKVEFEIKYITTFILDLPPNEILRCPFNKTCTRSANPP